MKVQHTGSEPVYSVAVGDWVQPKQEIDVPEDVGHQLVDQGWVSARSKAAKRVARKRAAKKKAPEFKPGGTVPKPGGQTVRLHAGDRIDPPATAEQED